MTQSSCLIRSGILNHVEEGSKHGGSSSASLMACVEESISERESGSYRFEEGLNTEVKLEIYKWFGKSAEFKEILTWSM